MQSFWMWVAIIGWGIVIVQNARIIRSLVELIVDKVRR